MSAPRFFKSVVVAVLMVFVGLSGAVGASVSPSRPEERVNETWRLWFVEMESEPLAGVDLSSLGQTKQGYLDRLADEKAEFRAAAGQAGIRFAERFSFGVLWNGLSIDIDPTKLPALSRVPGVRALFPVMTFTMPQVESVEIDPPVAIPETEPLGDDPNLITALAMTGADVAQSELGFTGAGIRVAVMDTGVDYDHPDLGGCFGPGCRVETGFDFVGDAFNADSTSPSYNPTPVPDPLPDDCNGHGTHVAGIVGASGGVTGVAPGVTFGAYRVFGCDGSTTADIMIAAMEAALEDDMDVLNMSIGSAFQWPEYPTARASDELVEEGMVVVASIGNSGASGVYSSGAPGVGEKVIGVASYDNTNVHFASFTISLDGARIGYANAAGAPPAPLTGSLPMARTGTSTTTNDACNALPAGSLTGKAVLIRRGTCTFYVKSRNALLAGASAVVLYNNVAGRFSPTVAGSPPVTIPVVAISDTEGVLINNRLAAGAVTLTWTDDVLSLPNPTGGRISSFSSYGLAPDLSLKPDIGAPGGLIRSTWPLERGTYNTISGTSMSSPHVAGAAALLLQSMDDDDDDDDDRDGDDARGDGRHRGDDDERSSSRDRDDDRDGDRAEAVRDILQNSADPRAKGSGPFPGALDNVHRQGAGMLDIDDAILATIRITPGKLSLGESEAGPATRTLTIENRGSSDVTLDLSNEPALSTFGSTFAPSFATESASVQFSQKGVAVTSVKVPGRDNDDDHDDDEDDDDWSPVRVKVTITANPALPDKALYGGYAVFTPRGGGPVLRVPYAGFKGDYQSIVAMTPTGNAFPWITKRVAFNNVLADFVKQGNGATFTCASGDTPWFLIHLDHQVQRLRAEVFEKSSGKTRGQALQLDFVGRNSAAGTFFAISWDCTVMKHGKARALADGNYVIVLSALKALGDEKNSANTETWMSPDFNVDRP